MNSMSFKKIFGFFFFSKNAKVYPLLFMVLFIGFLEFIGIGTFVTLLDESNPIINLYVSELFGFLNIHKNQSTIAIFLICLFLTKLIIVISFDKYISFYMNKFVFETRFSLLKKISKADFLKLQKISIASLDNLINKESEKISEGYTYVLDILLKVTLVAVYISLSLLININATLLTLVFGSIFILGFIRIVKLAKKYSMEIVSSNEKTNNYSTEFFGALNYIFSTNNSNFILKSIRRKLWIRSLSQYKLDYFGKLSKNIPEPVGIIIVLVIILISSHTSQESITLVLMSSFLLYKTFRNITSLQYVYQKLTGLSGSLEKVINISNKLDDIAVVIGNKRIKRIDSIEIENLDFSFKSQEVLESINFSFKRGKSYAIVGDSGSGKTTLLNLITLLYEVQKGNILINGVSSKELNQKNYRNQIGYVSQRLVFFDKSMKENILLGRNMNVDFKNLISGLELSDLILKKGLDNAQINMSKTLSGGQIQKINIAREINKNPSILILDEATSSLDSEAEKNLMKYIYKSSCDKMLIIVAHRLSSIMDVDEVLFLENGSITASGDMKTLYESKAKFKEMCNNQSIYL